MGMSTDGFPITPHLHSWAYNQVAHTKNQHYEASFKGHRTTVRADTREEALRLTQFYFRTHQPKQIYLRQLPKESS